MHAPTISCFVAVLFVSTGSAVSETNYGSESTEVPECIVVGQLVGVVEDAFSEVGPQDPLGSRTAQLFSTGTIEVGQVLLGERVPERLQVAWCSGTREISAVGVSSLDPVNPVKYSPGDVYIWVIRSKIEEIMQEGAKYYRFQTLPVDSKEVVIRDIEELRLR